MIKLGKKNDAGTDEKKTEREKVDERRDEILARGKKFKYPLQFTKRKLVRNTIIIAAIAVGGMMAVGWVSLYNMGSTGDVIYRIVRVLPLPVAEVQGENVRFSDYLMFYRSSIRAIEQQSGDLGGDENANEIRNRYKREALDKVEELTYAMKIAKENNIVVTNEEIQEAFSEHRNAGGIEKSEESFLKVILDNFGLSKDEYLRMLELSLYKKKVEIVVDQRANQIAEKVEKMLGENGGSFGATRDVLGGEIIYEETGGLVDSKNIDGGRSTVALGLQSGEISRRFVSSNGDGYYFVKLIEKNETQVNYASIKVDFMEFQERMGKIREEGEITEYIEIE